MFEKIVTLCKQHNTSPTALCKLITGSTGNLPTWKNDNIRSSHVLAIAEYFDVSTDYLLGLTDTKKAPSPLGEDADIAFDRETIAAYDALPPDKKKLADDYIKLLFSHEKYSK